ncbi:hypothetical protein ACJX0J_014925 [Zea mays]
MTRLTMHIVAITMFRAFLSQSSFTPLGPLTAKHIMLESGVVILISKFAKFGLFSIIVNTILLWISTSEIVVDLHICIYIVEYLLDKIQNFSLLLYREIYVSIYGDAQLERKK